MARILKFVSVFQSLRGRETTANVKLICCFKENITFFSRKYHASVVGVYSDEKAQNGFTFTEDAEKLNQQSDNSICKLLCRSGKPLKRGQSRLLYGAVEEQLGVAVACLGERGLGYSEPEQREDGSEAVREAVGGAIGQLQACNVTNVDVDPCGNAKAAAEAAYLRLFSYDELKMEAERKTQANLSLLCASKHQQREWRCGRVLAEGQNLARWLMEMPPNILYPESFCQRVEERFSAIKQVSITVRDEAWAKQQRMGGLLGVAQGSTKAPRFLELSYTGASQQTVDKPLVLVGKGVTFDSGGISIKPSAGMEAMRADMGGAACVVGAIWSAASLRLPLDIKGYIALCENMPSGTALRPGDVIRARNGKSIQVDNTDAEGRLILADALDYAVDQDPAAIIDLATLTGAMDVALGSAATGTFSSCSDTFKMMQQAGSISGDRVVRMPLFSHYSRQVTESHLADVNNVGKHGRQAGACTAAAFLKEFVPKDVPWMHMDIAGVMENKDEYKYLGRGMAGRPTRTLVEFCNLFSNRLT